MALGVVGRTFHITQLKDLKAHGNVGRLVVRAMLMPFAYIRVLSGSENGWFFVQIMRNIHFRR